MVRHRKKVSLPPKGVCTMVGEYAGGLALPMVMQPGMAWNVFASIPTIHSCSCAYGRCRATIAVSGCSSQTLRNPAHTACEHY